MDGGAGSVKTIVGRPGATLPLHAASARSEEHTSELQSQSNLVCRLLLEKKKKNRMSDSVSQFLPSFYARCILCVSCSRSHLFQRDSGTATLSALTRYLPRNSRHIAPQRL